MASLNSDWFFCPRQIGNFLNILGCISDAKRISKFYNKTLASPIGIK